MTSDQAAAGVCIYCAKTSPRTAYNCTTSLRGAITPATPMYDLSSHYAIFTDSQVELLMDNTNLIILQSVRQAATTAYQSMTSFMLPLINFPPTLASSTVRVLTPVYGTNASIFRNAAVAGFVSTVPYTMSMALSVTVFILDKLSGLLPRIGAAGVRFAVL